jgi:hypothetical protein
MEELILEIHSLKPSALSSLGWEPFDWEQGKKIPQGMAKLRVMLAELQRKSK